MFFPRTFSRMLRSYSSGLSEVAAGAQVHKWGERVGLPEPVMTATELEALIKDKLAKLPFFVERTAEQRSLPVYSALRNGGTRELTIIRHVFGDAAALGRMLKGSIPGIKAVEVRATQRKVILKGNFVQDVKIYLTDLGF